MLKVCEGTLMRRDRPLAHIVITDIDIYSIEQIETDLKYFPIELKRECTPYNLKKFFEARTTPRTRNGMKEELKKYGIGEYNIPDIVRISNGRCCADPYWVRFEEGPQTWEDAWKAIGVYNRV